MLPTRQGAFRLFQFAGIEVFLHWSWFLVAVISIQTRSETYSSFVWNGLEYLALFVIVTMHEFGHALACRSVGGRANQIVLWPLGGVAYVDPPARPGAQLWSIAAGPLVNVVLLPVLYTLTILTRQTPGNIHEFILSIYITNLVLLVFNLLPVYPLDGGQILRSLLWFVIGPLKSLTVAAIIGFIGVAGFLALAIWMRSVWFGIMTGFIGLQCWKGYRLAQALTRITTAPRRAGAACPACQAAPPVGAFWGCGKCRTQFDTFATQATCPKCATQFTATRCVACGASTPIEAWTTIRATAAN
ncbi:MAG: M50 family metallopeptidase [Verrucomicrobiota bacterium]